MVPGRTQIVRLTGNSISSNKSANILVMASVLLVEDEVFLGQIVKDSLEVRGFQVQHATDGLQGLNLFTNAYTRCSSAGCNDASDGWFYPGSEDP
jgi:PleD family two-component response regulator